MSFLKAMPDGSLLLHLRVQPNARKDELAGTHEGSLKIRLTSSPIEGKANKALVAFIAKRLGLPKSSIRIVSGMQGRNKKITIRGCSVDAARSLLIQEGQ